MSSVVDMTTPVVIQSIGERVRAIAALHALIAFLEANPDIPAPTTVYATFHVHGGSAGGREDVVTAAAATMGVEIDRHPTYVDAEMDFAPKQGFGSNGYKFAVRTHTDAAGI